MTTPITLSTAPFEHGSMDYAFLRQEGIRHIERMAGHIWTDFNAHDPGVTILELLCYAITDLAYRIEYTIPDLLTDSGAPTHESLYGPTRILPSHAVTLEDFRKLLIDLDKVKNAWIEPLAHPPIPLYFEPGANTLTLQKGHAAVTQSVDLKGLYRVLLQLFGLPDEATKQEVRRAVLNHLHAHRNLCEDIEELQVLDVQPVQVQAEIEIDPTEHPEDILFTIHKAINTYISPSPQFKNLSELLGAGVRMDDIFLGPQLHQGFIDTQSLDQAQPRKNLRTSDLIHILMDVPRVQAVRMIRLTSGSQQADWFLALDPSKTPAFDYENSEIRLVRNQLQLIIDNHSASFKKKLDQGQLDAPAAAPPDPEGFSITPPAGRNRHASHYYSVQHQFPDVYGIGERGLSASVPPQRRAQAKQLKAYLMFFDQLLANYFAQLASIKSLFSFYESSPRTYVSQTLDDTQLGLRNILVQPDDHRKRLAQITENPYPDDQTSPHDGSSPPDYSRRNRFLSHLLARFAEQFTDYGLMLSVVMSHDPTMAAEKLAQDKQRFLQNYPEISRDRGSGLNFLKPRGQDNISGLERRLQHKLGFMPGAGEALYVIEHILLRPMPGDQQRSLPVLTDVVGPDPYSLQFSVILPNWPQRFQHESFRLFVEQTVRGETPAHLVPHILWFGQAQMDAFIPVYNDWVDQRYLYEMEKVNAASTAKPSDTRVREARDRLIDMLTVGPWHMGHAYPLSDVAVSTDPAITDYGAPATIVIDPSQADVWYELRDLDGNTIYLDAPNGTQEPIQAQGNGGRLELPTPPLTQDQQYRIYAFKPLLGKGKGTYLDERATVREGPDTKLNASIRDAPLLQPSVAAPADTAPRIINYGGTVEVEVQDSQAGITYELVEVEHGRERVISAARVTGDGNHIVLNSLALQEDTDIRIRATIPRNPGDHEPPISALLLARLPLKVRANPAIQVAAMTAIIDYRTQAILNIVNSQQSVTYRAYLHPIADLEYIRTPLPDTDVLAVPVPGKTDVQVLRPQLSNPWQAPLNYALSPITQRGNGGTLQLPLPPLTDDQIVIVEALKTHQEAPAVTSSVQVMQSAMILVRPNPSPPLRLRAPLQTRPDHYTIQVLGGQPGVLYYPRLTLTGPDLCLPAYVNKRDPRDPWLNKGLEQTRVEVDLIVSPDASPPGMPFDPFRGIGQTRIEADFIVSPDPSPQPAPDDIPPRGLEWRQLEVDFVVWPEGYPDQTPPDDTPVLNEPEPPTWEVNQLPLNGRYFIRAVKAQTGVEALLDIRTLPGWPSAGLI